jgi:predicted O-methyltransferase YrrM
MVETFKINYNSSKTELCEIGGKYDTDKSSQRKNVTNTRHCHPYTLFYDSLFKNKRNDILNIAELGILHGSSLRMWQEYFKNSKIYGFEYDNNLIDNFKKKYDNERITLSNIDVSKKDSIIKVFGELNIVYDIIIEDTTHQFDDQIRVIENIYPYLKPGGILIIEDVFKSYNEQHYIDKLRPILHHFQDYYFIELDHVNRNSTGWNNDKLFILVKGGDQPIFKNNNKMTIITPSYRIDNLVELKKSIDFDYVDEWIIVYDGSKITENPNLFDTLNNNNNNNKIKEHIHTGEGISGNPQRNYGLSKITNADTMLYFLDDDNIIHPKIYKLLDIIDNTKMYTFDQQNGIRGNNININHIDTAMCLIPYNSCNDIKWNNTLYNSDGYYIIDCYNKNKNNHVYINNGLCYYNKIACSKKNDPGPSSKNLNTIKPRKIENKRYKMNTIFNSMPNSVTISMPNSNNRLNQLFKYKT